MRAATCKTKELRPMSIGGRSVSRLKGPAYRRAWRALLLLHCRRVSPTRPRAVALHPPGSQDLQVSPRSRLDRCGGTRQLRRRRPGHTHRLNILIVGGGLPRSQAPWPCSPATSMARRSAAFWPTEALWPTVCCCGRGINADVGRHRHPSEVVRPHQHSTAPSAQVAQVSYTGASVLASQRAHRGSTQGS